MIPWAHPIPQPKLHLDRFSHLSPIFSRTLASVGRSEIGLKLFCIDMGGLTFGAGMTSADFQTTGTALKH